MCCGQLKSDSLAETNNASAADLAPLDTAFWSKQQEDLSSQGLRVLALCRCADCSACGYVCPASANCRSAGVCSCQGSKQ